MNRVDEQFDDLDARLMLLAAGELPAGEAQVLRAQVERDTALSARYEAMASGLEELGEMVDQADRSQPTSPVRERAAARAAGRAVRAWASRDAAAQTRVITPSPIETAVWRYARWPLAAAAAMVVGLILFTTFADPDRGTLQAERPSGNSPDQVPVEEDYSPRRYLGDRRGQGRGSHPVEARGLGTPPQFVDRGDDDEDLADDSGERLARLFEGPAAGWEDEGDFEGLALGFDLSDELAALRALGDAWSDEGF